MSNWQYVLALVQTIAWRRTGNKPLSEPMMTYSGIILCMRPANGRRRCNATSSLIGWAHTQNDPCLFCPRIYTSLGLDGLTHFPKCGKNYKNVIFYFILRIEFLSTSCEIAVGCMPQYLIDDRSKLFRRWFVAVRHQAIAWTNVDNDTDLCRHLASSGHSELKSVKATAIHLKIGHL